jgi:four helix bundle protein
LSDYRVPGAEGFGVSWPSMAQHFKDLIAWQKAMELVNDVYDATDAFPQREIYSLTNQIRRAAVSIPSNIAEGQAHFSNREFLHFLRHSRGSLAELETQLLVAGRRNYLPESEVQKLLDQGDESSRILSGLIHSIKERESTDRG